MCVRTWQLYIESVLLLLPFRLLWCVFNPACIATKGHDAGLLTDLTRAQARLAGHIKTRYRTNHLLGLVFVIPDFHKIRCPPFNWHLQRDDVFVKLVHVVDQQSRHHPVQPCIGQYSEQIAWLSLGLHEVFADFWYKICIMSAGSERITACNDITCRLKPVWRFVSLEQKLPPQEQPCRLPILLCA